jgi:hypothetical protein
MGEIRMRHVAVSLRIAVAILMFALFATPASAQKVPEAMVQEILIKTSLLTFNDANTTGNYEVFHAKLAKAFQDKYSTEKVAETFKGFHDRHIYLDLIAIKTPVPSEKAKVDGNGRLTLKGYFDTSPSRVYYDLAYVLEGDEWRLVQITVNLKKPDQ